MVEPELKWDTPGHRVEPDKDCLSSRPISFCPDLSHLTYWRAVEALAVVALMLVFAARLFAWLPHWWQAGSRAENDFAFYYLAGWRLRLGLSPYGDLLAVREWARLPASFGWGSDTSFPPVGNPPLLLYLFLPFTWLPYRSAWLVWSGISTLGLAAATAALWRALLPRLSPAQRVVGLLVALGFTPWAHHLRWARAESLVLLALTGSLLCLRSGHQVRAGALAGLATCLRLYPGLFLPYFVITRSWRAATAMVGAVALLAGATILPGGLSNYQRVMGYVLPVLTDRFLASTANLSLPSVLARLELAGMGLPSWLVYALQAAVVSIALVACRMAPHRVALGYGLIVVTVLLCSPITWYHSLVLLAIPLLAAAGPALRSGARSLSLGLIYVACCWDTVLTIKTPWPVLPILVSIWPFYGLLALYVLLIILMCQPLERLGHQAVRS